MDASISHPQGIPHPSGLYHTDYSDINEAMCFLGIIHHPTARLICEVGGASWTPQKAVKTIESEIPKLEGSFLDPADIAVVELLKTKLIKAGNVPTAHLAARIKAIQGFNMSLFLIKVFGGGIKEVYFTNTRSLLIAALRGGAPQMSKIIANNILSHPADLLLILEDARGRRQPYGVSCKASFGKTTPTICNLGLGSVNKMILGNNSGCMPITTDGVEAGMKSGVHDAMISVLRDKQVELAVQLAAHFSTTLSAPRLLLTNFLHIQPNNLPYCIVSAEGQAIHGIDFERVKNKLATYDGNFTGGAGAPAEGVISSSIILQGGEDLQFEFKTRLKKAGSRGVSLKLNVTLSNTLKRLLMNHYLLAPHNSGGGKRVKHGGSILKSGFDTNLGLSIRTPTDNDAARAEVEEKESWLAAPSTPEDPIDGPYPTACGGAARMGGRRKICSSRKKRHTKHKRKKRKCRRKTRKKRKKTHRRRQRRRKTRRRRRKKY